MNTKTRTSFTEKLRQLRIEENVPTNWNPEDLPTLRKQYPKFFAYLESDPEDNLEQARRDQPL